MKKHIEFNFEGNHYVVDIERKGDTLYIEKDGKTHIVDIKSEKIIEKYGLVHISTGDLLREEVAAQTELGVKAKAIMDRGELVSDDIVIGMIRKKLEAYQGSRVSSSMVFQGPWSRPGNCGRR